MFSCVPINLSKVWPDLIDVLQKMLPVLDHNLTITRPLQRPNLSENYPFRSKAFHVRSCVSFFKIKTHNMACLGLTSGLWNLTVSELVMNPKPGFCLQYVKRCCMRTHLSKTCLHVNNTTETKIGDDVYFHEWEDTGWDSGSRDEKEQIQEWYGMGEFKAYIFTKITGYCKEWFTVNISF